MFNIEEKVIAAYNHEMDSAESDSLKIHKWMKDLLSSGSQDADDDIASFLETLIAILKGYCVENQSDKDVRDWVIGLEVEFKENPRKSMRIMDTIQGEAKNEFRRNR